MRNAITEPSLGGRIWPWLGLLVLGALFVSFFRPAMAMPFERDEGEYALAADILNEGGLPYRDVFLQKPPGIVFIYQAVFALVGKTPVALRIGVIAAYLAVGVMLFLLARRWNGTRAGLAACAVFLMAVLSPLFEGIAANTEAFMIVPLTLTLLFLADLDERTGWRRVFLMGLAFGLAIFIKQVAAVHGLVLMAALLVTSSDRRQRLVRSGQFLLGAALPYIAAIVAWAWAGALGEFLDCVLLHNLEYIKDSLEPSGWNVLKLRLDRATPFDWLVAASALAGPVWLAVTGRRHAAVWLTAWLGACIWGVSRGGFYRGHYFIQALPVAALGAGLIVGCRVRMAAASACLALTISWVFSGSLMHERTPEDISLRRYNARRFANAVYVADWLKHQGAGSLFVLGSEPEIYYHSGCRPVSRYVIMNPLFGGFGSSRARQEEALADFDASPPRFLVLSRPDYSIPLFGPSDGWLYLRIRERTLADYELAVETHWETYGLAVEGTGNPDLQVYVRRGPGSI